MPAEIERLRWVEQADAVTDAKAAIDRGDSTLIGVHGYTWSIPGVHDEDKFRFRDEYGLKLLEGTREVVLNAEHERLKGIATKYAKIYNEYLLNHANQKRTF
jgi:hypothetical protein